jgi:hypothetical protein
VGIDKEYVGRENGPLKQWDIETVFEKQVENKPEQQYRVAQFFEPNQDAYRELNR